MFDDKDVRPIRNAVAMKQAEIFIDAACRAELERVLGYPFGKRTLGPQQQQACLAECLRQSNFFVNEASREAKAGLPRCRDPDDQIFLEAALAAGAGYLITRDRALLELERRRSRSLAFLLLTPEAFASEDRARGRPRHPLPRS